MILRNDCHRVHGFPTFGENKGYSSRIAWLNHDVQGVLHERGHQKLWASLLCLCGPSHSWNTVVQHLHIEPRYVVSGLKIQPDI